MNDFNHLSYNEEHLNVSKINQNVSFFSQRPTQNET